MERIGTLRRTSAAQIFAAAAAFSGGVHLSLAPEHFHEATWLGWAFVGDGVALVLAALWLGQTGSTRAWRAVTWISGLTAVAYVASRTIGLPTQAREAWDSLGLWTTGAECAVVGAGIAVISARLGRARHSYAVPARGRGEVSARQPAAAWGVVALATLLAVGAIIYAMQSAEAPHRPSGNAPTSPIVHR